MYGRIIAKSLTKSFFYARVLAKYVRYVDVQIPCTKILVDVSRVRVHQKERDLSPSGNIGHYSKELLRRALPYMIKKSGLSLGGSYLTQSFLADLKRLIFLRARSSRMRARTDSMDVDA